MAKVLKTLCTKQNLKEATDGYEANNDISSEKEADANEDNKDATNTSASDSDKSGSSGCNINFVAALIAMINSRRTLVTLVVGGSQL